MSDLGFPTYSERLRRRLEVWWQKPRDLGSPRTYLDFLHQVWERNSARRRHDPEWLWHCCRHWQRSLSNKWNAREFAIRHRIPVPVLYWRGRDLSRLEWEALPDRYVIRASFGHSRQAVFVVCDGMELLRSTRFRRDTARELLWKPIMRLLDGPILVEEMISGDPDGCGLPFEAKVHTFGEHIGAIQWMRRSAVATETEHGVYSEDWDPFSDFMVVPELLRPAAPVPAPRMLPDLVEYAIRLGRSYGTYVRVDFFVTEDRIVFNEFSTTPGNGAGFTPFFDEYFGRLWQDLVPDCV
jgi:hypothetical protein